MGPVHRPTAGQLRRFFAAAISGIVAAGIFIGIADLLARFFAPASSPLIALGNSVIELAPPAVQDVAISIFGSSNKLVLVLGMGIGGAVLAAGIGLLARRRLGLACGTFAAVAAVLLATVVSRPETSLSDLVPTALGAVSGVAALVVLIRASGSSASGSPAESSAPGASEPSQRNSVGEEDERPSRRMFLTLTAAGTVAAAASLSLGRSVGAFTRTAGAAISEMVLPSPAVRAAAIPAETVVDIDGVEPFITPNDEFYRIDTALAVPELTAEEWSLRIHGLVEEEVTLDMPQLLDLPLEEHHITLTCVSNPVGGDLLGTATWLGYPVRELLARAKPLPEADMVLSRSVDGFTASTPLETLTDSRDSLLAIGMNGDPLPAEHGFPARLVVPGLYGYVSATKWVIEMEVTRFDQDTAYWTDRGWDEKAPVLVSSRIDVPGSLQEIDSGDVIIAGSAWSQQEGIEKVEVKIDDGEWQEAELAAEVSADTWRQWRYVYADAGSGRHSVTVRATNAAGETQTDERRDPIPNAATGQHRIEFRVS